MGRFTMSIERERVKRMNLEEILKECNRLRFGGRVVCLHRTLHEFSGFVDVCIFGMKHTIRMEHMTAQAYKMETDIKKHSPTKITEETELMDYAKAFLKYCQMMYEEKDGGE